MSRRRLTAAQEAARDGRRTAFREIARKVGAMGPQEREALAARVALRTVEGHALSVHNSCLIWSQRPSATVVAGFRQWKRAGRVVQKGEKGLALWVPVGQRADDPNREPGEVSSADQQPGFIMGTVFDVSQTAEGQP